MLLIRLLAAIHMVLILRAPITREPGTAKPVAVEPAAQPPVQKGPREKVRAGSDEALVWVDSQKPHVKIETHRGVSFNVDFATHSAMCLAGINAELSVEPRGLTLSMSPTNGILSVGYDKETKQFQVFMNGGKEPVSKFPVKLSTAPTRVLLRQREQLALYAIPPDGSHVTLVWLGRVSYRVAFRNAAQYDLCSDVKITMGKRQVTQDEFRTGIKMDALDEIADVVITGTSPVGDPFQHRYVFNYKDVNKLVDGAYGAFMQAAGNSVTEEEAGIKTTVPDISP